MKNETSGRPTGWWLLVLIAGGLLVWGGLFALGAYLNLGSTRPEPERAQGIEKGLIVLGCTIAFLGFWGIALWNRGRRLRRSKLKSSDATTD